MEVQVISGLTPHEDGRKVGAGLVDAQQRLRKMVLDTLPSELPPQLRQGCRASIQPCRPLLVRVPSEFAHFSTISEGSIETMRLTATLSARSALKKSYFLSC